MLKKHLVRAFRIDPNTTVTSTAFGTVTASASGTRGALRLVF